MREEFEAWATKHRMPIHRDGVVTDYAARCTDECWQAWKASRAALRVELPDKAKFVEYYEDLEGGTFNWQRYMVAIQEALQQAGIEVK
ncbi:hypothetical protein APB31_23610 [Pseudomonas aeruginosa]|nr:hypothetical protein AO916_14775 [Pseudomonas aeruginosa]KSQ52221.1 hypothetical protein APB31_23610 [Pseudomonas aeruginosa]HBO8372100.1 hypothetical protein [Pseudomonas aeruginosa]HBP0750577.1 hypothetical protein [Pseudomonas aeruginosa]